MLCKALYYLNLEKSYYRSLWVLILSEVFRPNPFPRLWSSHFSDFPYQADTLCNNLIKHLSATPSQGTPSPRLSILWPARGNWCSQGHAKSWWEEKRWVSYTSGPGSFMRAINSYQIRTLRKPQPGYWITSVFVGSRMPLRGYGWEGSCQGIRTGWLVESLAAESGASKTHAGQRCCIRPMAAENITSQTSRFF